MYIPEKRKNSQQPSRNNIKYIALMLTIIVLVVIIASQAFIVRQNGMLIVDQQNASCNVADRVYCTISDAVDNASENAVINVHSGTYRENIYLTAPITLRGIGEVIIDPYEWETVRVHNVMVTLENLTLGGQFIGLSLNGNQSIVTLDSVTIATDSILKNLENTGIAIRRGEQHTLTMIDTTIDGASIGIRINGGTGTVIDGKSVTLTTDDVDLMLSGGSQYQIITGVTHPDTLIIVRQGGFQHIIDGNSH